MCAVNVAEGNLEERWEGAKTLHKTMITLPRWWHTNSVDSAAHSAVWIETDLKIHQRHTGPHTCKDAHIT